MPIEIWWLLFAIVLVYELGRRLPVARLASAALEAIHQAWRTMRARDLDDMSKQVLVSNAAVKLLGASLKLGGCIGLMLALVAGVAAVAPAGFAGTMTRWNQPILLLAATVGFVIYALLRTHVGRTRH